MSYGYKGCPEKTSGENAPGIYTRVKKYREWITDCVQLGFDSKKCSFIEFRVKREILFDDINETRINSNVNQDHFQLHNYIQTRSDRSVL